MNGGYHRFEMESHKALVPTLPTRQRPLHRANSLQPEFLPQRSSVYPALQKSRNPGRSLTEIYTAKTKSRASSSDPAFSLRRRTLTTATPSLYSSASTDNRDRFLNRSFSEMSWSSVLDDSNSVSSYGSRQDAKQKEDAYSVIDSESLVSNKTTESLLLSSDTEEECDIEVEKANNEPSCLWLILKNCFKMFFWITAFIFILIIIVLVFSMYVTYVKTQCDMQRKVKLPLKDLNKQLSESVIGQEIATSVIVNSLKNFENYQKNSPLVMWMVGWTGSGKTYTTNILKNVFSSTSQVLTVIPSLYPQNDITLLKQKVKELYDELHPCSFNVIVIDGWDENDQPFEILEQLLVHFRIGLHQQRELGRTLIVLSGTKGSKSINQEYLRLHHMGKKRETFRVEDFKIVTEGETEGKKMLGIMKSYIFVPFLPMEIMQVQECITEELSKMNKTGFLPKDYSHEKITELVIGQLDFIPASYPLLAVTGCKRVQALLRLSLSKDASAVL
ncbi:torsin-1A-like [Palaemon carinicauda]|uniref:torsin-1A-like n=1 Tax=Palaemon carinicauda TaxID=392227 RepID=UPI0035B57E31